MPQKDYYKTLGVDAKASKDDIKKAYRRLAKKYHPDRNKGDAAAEQRFKEISEAHSVLNDDKKRRQYDLMGDAAAHGGPGADFWQSVMGGRGGRGRTQHVRYEDLGDMGDLFSQFFTGGDAFGQSGRAAHRGPARGANVISRVRIPFDVAATGGKIKVKVPVDTVCKVCSGAGADPKQGETTCPTCNGSGHAESNMGGFAFSRACPQCMGRGKILTKPCDACRGAGLRRTERTFKLSVPAGVRDGRRIRLAGQGSESPAGGKRGDVLVEVRVLPSREFRRKGDDVHSEATLSIIQATLGTTVEVDTVQGKTSVTVPPGTDSGAQLRLKGKGIRTKDGKAGDHYVTIKVATPKDLTDEQRRTLENFADSADIAR